MTNYSFLIFEYEIIRRLGRLLDVLLFLSGEVLGLKFKQYEQVKEPEYNQALLYIRDIESYYSTISEYELNVLGALIATSTKPLLEDIHNFQLYLIG